MNCNDIVKALECCRGFNGECDGCPLLDVNSCNDKLKQYAADAIKKQKIEIQSLNIANEKLYSVIKAGEKQDGKGMKGHVIVINGEGVRHLVSGVDGFDLENFVKDYYETFHQFDDDVFIFCGGSIRQALKIEGLFRFGGATNERDRNGV